ncbi:Uu.00g056000.m01.CDS01 [Anthostomella pinea]|uniref:Uu.00g056000.m01.CDS01 n=1 Tax=Anthostomella pinea TaxID=933095 RepID=A0AAI8VXT9_9PEZI|nr:Uu.00g056000.m01.CDS01 [Anthostomella pinea]
MSFSTQNRTLAVNNFRRQVDGWVDQSTLRLWHATTSVKLEAWKSDASNSEDYKLIRSISHNLLNKPGAPSTTRPITAYKALAQYLIAALLTIRELASLSAAKIDTEVFHLLISEAHEHLTVTRSGALSWQFTNVISPTIMCMKKTCKHYFEAAQSRTGGKLCYVRMQHFLRQAFVLPSPLATGGKTNIGIISREFLAIYKTCCDRLWRNLGYTKIKYIAGEFGAQDPGAHRFLEADHCGCLVGLLNRNAEGELLAGDGDKRWLTKPKELTPSPLRVSGSATDPDWEEDADGENGGDNEDEDGWEDVEDVEEEEKEDVEDDHGDDGDEDEEDDVDKAPPY